MVKNISKFTHYDILRTLLILKDCMSRSNLVSELEIGEGTIRTILGILKHKNLITSSKKGHCLSQKGKKFMTETEELISVPIKADLDKFFEQYINIGMVMKKLQNEKRVSYKLRDIAIKNGADAALIFNHNLRLLDTNYNRRFVGLEMQFKLKPGELLIVTSSRTRRWAEISALAVACELNEKVKHSISRKI